MGVSDTNAFTAVYSTGLFPHYSKFEPAYVDPPYLFLYYIRINGPIICGNGVMIGTQRFTDLMLIMAVSISIMVLLLVVANSRSKCKWNFWMHDCVGELSSRVGCLALPQVWSIGS